MFTDPLVGAEGELEDHLFLDNESDSILASSISVIQQQSSTRVEAQDENLSSTSDESWMYPYPHFQVPVSSHYNKMTREQLLSSKAHALGLLSSKHWIKSSKKINSDAPLFTRIKSSPASRIPKDLHGNSSFVPMLEGVNEKLPKDARKTKGHASKATHATDSRLKTIEANAQNHCTTSTTSSRPIHTSQGIKPQQQRVTSNARNSQQQSRKQCVVLTSKMTPHLAKRQLSG